MLCINHFHITPLISALGPGPAYIWTRSTHLYQHDATNNAEKPEKCVVRCHDCNEQRGNSPKPCCSLHAFPLYGAGLTLTWRRFPLPWRRFPLQCLGGSSHYTLLAIFVDCDDPRIVALRIFGPKRVTERSSPQPLRCMYS